MNKTSKLMIASVFCLAAAACAKKEEVRPSEPSMPPAPTTEAASDTGIDVFTPADLESNACLRERVIYFDLDRSVIKPEFADTIACHGKYLEDRPNARVTLESHADERGSRDYNLGLGERRGDSVSSALQSAGGSRRQIEVVSFGEERPTCRRHDEGCWSQNRRVEIVYTVR